MEHNKCNRKRSKTPHGHVSRSERPRFAVGVIGDVREWPRIRPAGFGSGRGVGGVGGWAVDGGDGRGRRWTGAVDGAGGRAAGRTKKTENLIKPTKTPHTPIHRNKRTAHREPTRHARDNSEQPRRATGDSTPRASQDETDEETGALCTQIWAKRRFLGSVLGEWGYGRPPWCRQAHHFDRSPAPAVFVCVFCALGCD